MTPNSTPGDNGRLPAPAPPAPAVHVVRNVTLEARVAPVLAFDGKPTGATLNLAEIFSTRLDQLTEAIREAGEKSLTGDINEAAGTIGGALEGIDGAIIKHADAVLTAGNDIAAALGELADALRLFGPR